MSKIKDLLPGDRTQVQGVDAVFLGADYHAKYPGFCQVMWYFFTHPLGPLKCSVDALSFEMEVQGLVPQTPLQRHETLIRVMEALNS